MEMTFRNSTSFKIIFIALFTTFCSSICINSSYAQNNIKLKVANVFGGQGNDAAIKENAAYFFQGHGIMVLDLSSENLQPVFNRLTPDQWPGKRPFIFGDSLYFRTDRSIHIFGITNPWEPDSVLSLVHDSSKIIYDWTYSNNHAYVIYNSANVRTIKGLTIIDLSNIAFPLFYDFPENNTVSISILGNTAYTIDKNRELVIYDVTNPANLVEIGRLGLNFGYKLFVSGDYAYITGDQLKGMGIVDISNPQNPNIVKSFDQGKSYKQVFVHGDRAFLNDLRSSTIVIVDVSDANNPTKLGEFESRIQDSKICNKDASQTLCLAGNSDEFDVPFQIVDFNDPADPVVLQEYNSPSTIRYTATSGNILYASSDKAGLYRYKLSDSGLPEPEGRYPNWSGAQRIHAQGDIVYFLDETGANLNIVDFSDPSNPQKRGSYSAGATLHEMLIQNDIGCFLDTESPTLQIVDLQNISNPTKIEEINLAGNGRALVAAPAGNLIYAAYNQNENNQGVQIINISNPTNPEIIGSFQSQGNPFEMIVSGNKLFITGNMPHETVTWNKNWFLEAYDIADPENPILITSSSGTDSPVQGIVALDEQTVILSLFTQGLATFHLQENTFVPGTTLDIFVPSRMSLFSIPPPMKINSLKTPADFKTQNYSHYIILQEGNTNTSGYDKKIFQCPYNIKIIETEFPWVTLLMWMTPFEALEECSTVPALGTHLYDKNETVNLSAIPGGSWAFKQWSGDVHGTVVNTSIKLINDNSVAIAEFVKPSLTVAGGLGVANVCAEGKDSIHTIMNFSLRTSEETGWMIHGVRFESRGTGNEKTDIKKVRLYFQNQLVDSNKYIADNSPIALKIDKEMAPNDFKTLRLEYVFEDSVELNDTPKTFLVDLKAQWVGADPMEYKPGVHIPGPQNPPFTGGPITMANVWNEDIGKGYVKIQDAINDEETKDGHLITVCPGIYDEKVIVNKKIALESVELHRAIIKPVINLSNLKINKNVNTSENPIIEIRRDSVSITGFTIQGTGKNKNQIGIKGDLSRDFIVQLKGNLITQNYIKDVKQGIYYYDIKLDKISDNIFEDVDTALSFVFSKYLTVQTNEIKKADIGAHLDNSDDVLLSENKFLLSWKKHIELKNSDQNTITKNEFEQSENDIHIYLENSNENSVSLNTSNHISHKGVSIKLQGSKQNKIFQHTTRSDEAGKIPIINLFASDKNSVYNNDGYNIKLYHTDFNNIKNNTFFSVNMKEADYNTFTNNEVKESPGIGVDIKNCTTNSINKNHIHNNGFDGIVVENSNGLIFKDNKITDHTFNPGLFHEKAHGILLKNCTNIDIISNYLVRNCTGIRDIGGSGNTISPNYLMDSFCLFTGISVDNSNTSIFGNTISNNNGTGIVTLNHATPIIHSNNIFGNSEYGISNMDSTVTVNAQNNWWGTETEPGFDLVNGVVDFYGWLQEPVALVAVISKDTLFAQANHTDSVFVAIQNFQNPNDIVDVILSDDKDWLIESSTFSLQLKDSLGASAPIRFAIPENVEEGIFDKIIVTAISESDQTKIATDSLLLFGYTPELTSVIIKPDSIFVAIKNTKQFFASGYDQHNNDKAIFPVWTTSSGNVDSTGLFFADSIEQVVQIIVTDTNTGIQGQTHVRIFSTPPVITKIEIRLDSVQLNAGESYSFSAFGFEEFGFPLDFNPIWNATGGTIDSIGFFVAGEQNGSYLVTATDSSTQVFGQAVVKIGSTTGAERAKKIIPNNYCLYQNYPNPFNPETTIRFDVKETVRVELKIYDMLGRELLTLLNDRLDAGHHKITFDAAGFASGLYLYKIKMGEYEDTKKMMLLK
jgi:parallel beta-helix repeat protein